MPSSPHKKSDGTRNTVNAVPFGIRHVPQSVSASRGKNKTSKSLPDACSSGLSKS